ncbi:MAG: methylmalonyl-CoA epimerase [Candidatus Nanopelagicales bacterium]|nr:methylmalonyl-CoA epimerase [Candidatus Nanopelagicales bacterium]
MESLIIRIDHVGIAVPDLAAAIEFHERVLGLQVLHEETNDEQGVHEAMLGLPGDTVRIQLLAPLTPESAIARFIDRSGPGLQQLAYTVTDVRKAADHFRAQGIRMLYDEPKRGTENSQINFAHPKDCGGVLIELVEPAAAL